MQKDKEDKKDKQDQQKESKGREEAYAFDTQLIHGGGGKGHAENAISPPIYQTSTFYFKDTDHMEDVMSFRSDDCVYSRGNNPTLKELEGRMAVLEGGAGAVAFSSGMAAISSVLFSLLESGDKVLSHRTLYGSSYQVMTRLFDRYQMEAVFSDLTRLEDIEDLLDDPAIKVIYLESPANPTLDIIDIRALSRLADKRGIKVVVDNTFASPYLQKPLLLGAHVVVHSATKYIGGHGDAVGGLAVATDLDYVHRLKFDFMAEFGGAMSPFNGWLFLRGLKTLSLRMDRHMDNAHKLARFLEGRDQVAWVTYPGLASHPQHDLATEQMAGYGGMVYFGLAGGMAASLKLLNGLKLIKMAVSLGDCETLIELPARMTHRGYDERALADFGMAADGLRISAGLEGIDDLVEDLSQALETL